MVYRMLRFPGVIDDAGIAANTRLLWAVIAAMLAALLAGDVAAGLTVDLGSGRAMLTLPLLCGALAWFYRVGRPDPLIAFGLVTVTQLLLILIAATLLTYAAAATALPYRDAELMSIDRALGFDWRAGLDFVNAHPVVGVAAHAVYFSMKPQPLVVIGALLVTGRFERLQQFVLALAVTLIVAIAIFMLVPAIGVFAHLQLAPADSPHFVPSMTYQEMMQLDGIRSGALHVIRFDALEGLISFPSFHTAAVLAAWAV
jgi:hypothetical protein